MAGKSSMAKKSSVSAQDKWLRVLELVLYPVLLSAIALFVWLFMPQSVAQFSLQPNGPQQPPSLVASCVGTMPCVISDGSRGDGFGWNFLFGTIQPFLVVVVAIWLTQLSQRVPNEALRCKGDVSGGCSLRLLNMAHRDTPMLVKLATWLLNPGDWRASLLLLYLALSILAGPLLHTGFVNFTYPASVSFPMNTTSMGARQSYSPLYGSSVMGVLGQLEPQLVGWNGYTLESMLLEVPPQVSTLCQRVPAGSVQKVITEGGVVVLGQVTGADGVSLPGLGGLISGMQDRVEQLEQQVQGKVNASMSANTTVYGLHMTTQRSSSLCTGFDACPDANDVYMDCLDRWPMLFEGDDMQLEVIGGSGTMLFARSSGPSMLIQSLTSTEGFESFWSIQLVRNSTGTFTPDSFTPMSITNTNKSFSGSFGLFNLNATKSNWEVQSPLTDYPLTKADGLGVLAAEDLGELITKAENYDGGALWDPWLQAVSMCFTVLDASPLPVSATLQAMLELAVFPADISMELQQSTKFTAGVWLMTKWPAVACTVMAGLAWLYLVLSMLLDRGMHQSECKGFGEAVAVVQCLPQYTESEKSAARSNGPELFQKNEFWDEELERVAGDSSKGTLEVRYKQAKDGHEAGIECVVADGDAKPFIAAQGKTTTAKGDSQRTSPHEGKRQSPISSPQQGPSSSPRPGPGKSPRQGRSSSPRQGLSKSPRKGP